jgi:hypothetical protein
MTVLSIHFKCQNILIIVTFQAIQVFFLLRNLSLCLRDEKESQLPLTNYDSCIKVEQLLDLSEF